jgi:TonB family protein
MRASLMALVVLLASPAAARVEGSAQATGDAKADEAPELQTAEGFTVPPRLTKQVKPKYPQAALDQKIEGEVVVEFLIDTKGRVARTRVVQSVPGLDEAAVECVRKWRFKPALKNGKPIATIARVPVWFKTYQE